jgi:hypothetical protein
MIAGTPERKSEDVFSQKGDDSAALGRAITVITARAAKYAVE